MKMNEEDIEIFQKMADINKNMSKEDKKKAKRQFIFLLHGSPKERLFRGLKSLVVSSVFILIFWFYIKTFNEGNISNMKFFGFVSLPFVIAGMVYFWQKIKIIKSTKR